MDTNAKLQLMMERFVHPNSKFAEQVYYDYDRTMPDGTLKKAGSYYFPVRRGDCTHEPRHAKMKECSDFKEIAFSRKFLRQHLMGDKTFAPYQVSEDGMIKYVCLDIDSYDDVAPEDVQAMAITVVRRINARLGRGHCLVETSGSKGYHVWIFFSKPVDVSYGYALGHELINGITLTKSINIEVYPKQHNNSRSYGNTIKIPLGVHRGTGNRCFFLKGDFTPHEDQWQVLSNVTPVDATWVHENVKKVEIMRSEVEGKFKKRTAKCVTEVMAEGCGEGLRDEAAFRIANYLHDSEVPDYMAKVSMDAWNTMNHPPLDEQVIDQKLESAYNANYPWKPCHLPVWDKHCHSSCYFFERKVERRWFKKDEDPVGQISRD